MKLLLNFYFGSYIARGVAKCFRRCPFAQPLPHSRQNPALGPEYLNVFPASSHYFLVKEEALKGDMPKGGSVRSDSP